MRLVDHRFFKNHLRKLRADGSSYAVTRYGYETTGRNAALYDVDVSDEDGSKEFHVDTVEIISAIHLAIEAHYGI